MLTSISPLGERARHNRWSLTVSWYLLATTLVGAAIGAILGLGGAALGWPAGDRAVAFVVLAVVAVLADTGVVPLPTPKRQVNEDWLGRYRGWAYGAGFGAQLGAGVVTVVTTATIYLTLAAEVATGSVLAGLAVGATFGLARGVPILAMAGTGSFSELAGHHRRLVGAAGLARRATVAVVSLAAVTVGSILIGGGQ